MMDSDRNFKIKKDDDDKKRNDGLTLRRRRRKGNGQAVAPMAVRTGISIEANVMVDGGCVGGSLGV